MTPKERAAMQQALGALEVLGYGESYAATDLREALGQQPMDYEQGFIDGAKPAELYLIAKGLEHAAMMADDWFGWYQNQNDAVKTIDENDVISALHKALGGFWRLKTLTGIREELSIFKALGAK